MSILGPLDPVLTQALASPSGPEDSGWHTGIVRSWDESSGVNVVEINGIALTNLKSVQSGIGVQYNAGDNVLILRKQTQYVVVGLVQSPGGQQSTQIQAGYISTTESTASTSKVNLATVGPVVNVNIGSSRRCLVLAAVFMSASAVNINAYFGGAAYVDISGATTRTNSVQVIKQFFCSGAASEGFGETMSYAQLQVGLNPGPTTFSMLYSGGPAAGITTSFSSRSLVVIPF